MKKYIVTFLLALFLTPLMLYAPSHSKVSLPPEQIQWNRYTSPNFEVLSIDDSHGRYLSSNIDSIKAWLITRWGFDNHNFPIKCRVMVVPNQEMFREFFGKPSPQFRVTPTEMSIWIAADDPRWATSTLSKAMTEVCLQFLEAKYQFKLPLWCHRGMPIVNGDLPTFRQSLGNLNVIFEKDLKVYWSKEILNMTPEILAKHPPDTAQWFDSESAAFLLMLYKEFGPGKFNKFLVQCRAGNPEAALAVFGFHSYDECDAAFKKFMFSLSSDIIGKGKQVTPNSYLTWNLP